MPRIKSAKKALRKSIAANERNRTRRSQLRTAIKKVRTAANGAEAKDAFVEAAKLLDRAGRKNLVHKNAANRTKSRLAKLAAAKK
ncbi:MAG: 30S ribosomal protein S20 [Gemmatimonadetes bacterium]|nr:30S ribosomal protein S20 [Gemmatimonadota bacterium]MBP6668463.1 30S ribosomal protein S20 [Gemmatimonadales bacterium]MBK6778851.1 30S ribosomal protein S20 [Gemmatimonadota bacterium]MBK7348838.1 30S ribosomal protein S20 [Gemmatimonadota bacterium]MBK7714402.1 30S ribosomal protein S20 [Gemmatimonadota bacterium]